MPETLDAQIQQLRTTIAALEAQRALLGDAVVDTAVAPLRRQLAALEAQGQLVPPEERRLVTILFADIVGSTAMAEQLDPEEWRQTVARVHSTVGTVITQHGGQVVQYLGDGLLALFGAQQATERDPENAIRAALDAQGILASEGLAHPVRIRTGIHTGPVVVGELGAEVHREFTATGDAMNLASRLQSAAPPGGVLISQDTYRYVRGVFDVTPQPPLTVKGKRQPIQTYLVRRAKPRPFHMVRRAVAGIETRTAGRERESRQLLAAYLDACERKRVVWVQLVGEAGVGKSRMVDDLTESLDLRPEKFRLLRGRAYAGDAGQPFALIRRMWFDRFRIAEDAPVAQAEAKWVQRFQEVADTLDPEPAQALGLLVGLPFSESSSKAGMRKDPAEVKGRAFVVSQLLLDRMRERETVVMLLEDLQWIDDSSWEWLAELVLKPAERESAEGGLKHGLLAVATARPEWRIPVALSGYPELRRTELAPLTDAASRELALDLLQKLENVPESLVKLIVERSEGMPYYAEELVNYFLDRGIIERTGEPWRFVPARLKEMPLPATLQHLLLTRLTGLSEAERAALQRGAIFGRNFWNGGLEALGVADGDRVLGQLQPRGLVELQPESTLEGQTEWSFHHQLLRDATYESILKRERAELHEAAARWLEAQALQAGRLDAFAGLLAEHAEKAGHILEAANWYLQAGERARAQGAVREARRFFERALDFLPPAEWQQRWSGLRGLEFVLAMSADREARRATNDALIELARVQEDGARLAVALELRAKARAMTEERSGPAQDLDQAEQAIAQARTAADPVTEIRAMGDKAVVLGDEGKTAEAITLIEQALERARGLRDPETLLQVLECAAITYGRSGDWSRSVAMSQEQIAAAHQSGSGISEITGFMNLGGGYILLGQYRLGRASTEQSLQLIDKLGARRWRMYDLLNLAETHYFGGDYRAALRLTEESLKEARTAGDSMILVWSLNELGMILEALEDWSGAESRYAEAAEIAGRASELDERNEAVASLAHCTLAQGRLEDARRFALEAWQYLQEHGSLRSEHPHRVYGLCADVFDALGEEQLSRAAIEAGYRALMCNADKISNREWRASYLQDDPFNRQIVELWERTIR